MSAEGSTEREDLWAVRGLARIAAALAAGSLSAEQLVRESIATIRERNPVINAFVSIDEPAALAEARAADARRSAGAARSPLDGVPMAVKDNIDVAGFPTSNGIAKGARVTQDAACIKPWRDAGLVILGKLNMHEAALGTTTENPHFGNTANPRDTRFSAGGSSGGSAAAVAAAMCPITLGSDTMGSIRLPAASCGLYGWKPGAGTGPGLRGVHLLHPDLDSVGPLARSADDIEAAMDLLGVPAASAQDLQALRITVLREHEQLSLHDEVHHHWEACQQALVPQTLSLPGYAPTPVRRALLLDIEVRLAASMLQSLREQASPVLLQMLDFGARVAPDKARTAAALVEQTRSALAALMREVDVLVSPASPVPPTRLGDEMVAQQADLLLLANLGGCPAAVLPAGTTAAGLPLGLHVMTAPGRERRLLHALRELSSRMPGA